METLGAADTFGSWGKTDFEQIYRLPDPREYYRVLCGLDYIIPDLAKGIFQSLIDYCENLRGTPPKVLDLGCSYGINAALAKFPLDLPRLAQRYASSEIFGLDADEILLLDRHFFRSWPRRTDASFIGLDTSRAAIAYAKAVGLLADGITRDLESEFPDARETALLRDADLIFSTGCVGYVSGTTFSRILECQRKGRMPIVASFVLRMFPYEPIATTLADFGLVTEKLDGVSFIQRRFSSPSEYDAAMDRLKGLDVDPAGKEADGLMHAELFLSRPAELIEQTPLSQIVSVTSGVNRRYGRRFRKIDADRIMLMH